MKTQLIRMAVGGLILQALAAGSAAQGLAVTATTAAEGEIRSACQTALRSNAATAAAAAGLMTVEVRRNRQAGHVVARCTASLSGQLAGQNYIVLLRVADLYVMGVSRLGDAASVTTGPDL